MESASSSRGRGYPHYAALRPLTGAHAAIYMSILDVNSDLGREQFPVIRQRVDIAIENLRRGGRLDYLPFGLLTRAWLRSLGGDTDGSRGDLNEAWEIAERGPMKLHMADIHLYRARLFRDKVELAQAGEMIRKLGYGRRDEELADAAEAAKSW